MNNAMNKGALKQQGAALIVSLLILAVMTLIGVTAMSQSGLETLMAGNFQIQTSSMSQAENELNKAEQLLADIATTAVTYKKCGKGTNEDGENIIEDGENIIEYCEDINPVERLIDDAAASGDGDFMDSYIEYLGPRVITGESIVIGRETPRAGAEIYLFRNTALHSNNDNGARRIVQSIYATEQAPDPSADPG